jgi:hypothetical protein
MKLVKSLVTTINETISDLNLVKCIDKGDHLALTISFIQKQ